jgi:hypothetical protein
MTIRDRITAALAQFPAADRLPTLRRMAKFYRELASAEYSEANRAVLAATMGMLSELRPQEVADVCDLMQSELTRLRDRVARRILSQAMAEDAWNKFLGSTLQLYPADIVHEADVHFAAPDMTAVLHDTKN